MAINNIFNNTPRMIRGYERIIVSALNFEVREEELINSFQSISKGSLEEVLLTYDNREFRYSLCVEGRGSNLRIKGEKYRMHSDYVGQIAAERIDIKEFNTLNLFEITEEFLVWVQGENY